MNSSQKSHLLSNIERFGLDSRIGKAVLSAAGTSIRMGERISQKPGSSPVIIDRRYYQKGDSLKDIDWKLTARTEKIFVKIREGYRQTDFVIVPDSSRSMKAFYGSASSKFITALSAAYIAGRIALKSKDRVYVIRSGQKIRIETEYGLLDLLMDMEKGEDRDIFSTGSTESGANVFILSDFFIETNTLNNFLKTAGNRSQNLYMISIHDPFEEDFSIDGRFRFLDTESDASVLAEARDIKSKYRHLYAEHYRNVTRIGRSFGARMGKISTVEDPYHAFVRAVS